MPANAVPFVSAVGDGLAQTEQSKSSPAWWQQLIVDISKPFAQAGASRLAYGTMPPYYPSGFTVQPYGGGYYGGMYGGFDPRNLMLIGGALIGALVLLKALK